MPNVRRGGRWANVRSGRHISSSNHQTDDDHAVHQSLLCFLLEKNALGVASYNIHTNDIHISKVSTEGNYTNVAKIIMALEQTTVILSKSSKENESFLNAIHAGFRDSDAQQSASGDASHVVENESSSRRSTENQRGELNISYLPNNEFSRVKAIELISLVSILGMPPNLTRDRRASFLVHILGEDDCVIRAVGGLLSFIVQHDILRAFGAESDSIHINAIHERNFCDVVSVSPTTLRALHVFHLDTHPVGRGSMQAKEGLSLFGILKVHIKTASARAMLRAWLMYPSTDTEKITQRQVMVRFLKGNENSAVLATLKDALRGVRNVPGVLSRFRKASASINDWKALFSSVKAFVVLLETLKLAVQQNSDIADSPLLKKANKVDESHLRETVNWIETIVDFEDSTAAGRMVVANGFSSRIDDLKRSYGGLDDFLSRIGAQELTRLLETENPLPLSTMQFTYKPQIGYLIALSEEECEKIGLKKFGEHGLSFMYSSFKDGLYFFKNERCNELDREIGDIHSAVIDLEAEAFRFLENKILDFSSTLYETASIICELDCLQALACSSKEYGWNMPEVSGNSQVLDIDDGRHALLELSVPCFIPNSTKMKHGDVHIVTGPNYSGKSVYLAQVALIVLLAQIGSCVPAKSARIGIIGSINTRVSSFESTFLGHSTFFIDASQVAGMLVKKQGVALNLIDEFGKGTSEADGMALLVCTIREMLRRPSNHGSLCLCTTHFVEILKDALLPLSDSRLAVFSMEVMMGPVEQSNCIGIDEKRRKVTHGRVAVSVGSRVSRLLSRNTESEKVHDENIGGIAPDGKAVRTYKLLTGTVCNESRALQCALEAGVPKFLLARAAHVHVAVSSNSAIEKCVATDGNNARIRSCSNIVRSFLSLSFEDGGN